MDWESRYLVMVDPSRNIDKQWQITRKGKRVLRQWGRRDGGSQHSIKEFETVFQASREMVDAVEEKRQKGYREDQGSIPLLPEFDKDGAPVDTRQGYFLAWQTVDNITVSDIREASAITRSVLDEIGDRLPWPLRMEVAEDWTTVSWPQAEEALSVRFLVNGNVHAVFGYPSGDFLMSLSAHARATLLEKNISRDGWLAGNGTGQGTIDTHRGWGDFPVRLFLSVLAMNGKIEVSDIDNQDYGTRGFRFDPADHRDFAWSEHWETVLKPAIRAHWVVEGEGLLIGRPSLKASPFAW